MQLILRITLRVSPLFPRGTLHLSFSAQLGAAKTVIVYEIPELVFMYVCSTQKKWNV